MYEEKDDGWDVRGICGLNVLLRSSFWLITVQFLNCGTPRAPNIILDGHVKLKRVNQSCVTHWICQSGIIEMFQTFVRYDKKGWSSVNYVEWKPSCMRTFLSRTLFPGPQSWQFCRELCSQGSNPSSFPIVWCSGIIQIFKNKCNIPS